MESPRGIHAIRVLSNRKDFTVQSLIDAAYDSYQPAFADLIPTLIKAYDQTPASDPLKKKVAEQIAMLRTWDYRWAVTSVPTTLACYWGDELGRRVHADADGEDMSIYQYMATRTSAHEKLDALAFASDSLTKNFGTWKMPWGEINRFQRLTDDIVHPFNDAAPSIPVGFTSARWGSLASFAPWEQETRRRSTARAATASSRWSSSATACARARSRPAARAATRRRSTSRIRRCDTARAIFARCTSIHRSSWGTPNARIIPGVERTRGAERAMSRDGAIACAR